MNPAWIVRTGRLVMRPVAWTDLNDLCGLKTDPLVFAIMLGGVRTVARVHEELASDIMQWGARGFGMWTVRDLATERFLGLAGLMERPDGRGVALRFGFEPEWQGRGYAIEAAGAALRYGHNQGGLARIIAVARESNTASRTLLGGIGMVACDSFIQFGYTMLIYESVAR